MRAIAKYPWAIAMVLAVATWGGFELFTASRDTAELSVIEKLAVERSRAAQAILFEVRETKITQEDRTELARTDIHKSGLLGIEWSPLVTTAGDYEAKLISTDPAWAALFVRWFERAGAAPGDAVAIGASGSFPGLLVAARVAAESMGIEPIVAGSLGASNFGATIPEFDSIDIDLALREAGLLEEHVALWTPGGDEDVLFGFEEDARAAIFARLDGVSLAGGAVLIPKNMSEAIGEREALLLRERDDVKLYLNIGGHAANYGKGMSALRLPSGYIDATRADAIYPPGSAFIGDSVAIRALRGGLPVVNLINLKQVLGGERAGFVGAGGLALGAERPSPAPRIYAGLCAALLAGFLITFRSSFQPERITI